MIYKPPFNFPILIFCLLLFISNSRATDPQQKEYLVRITNDFSVEIENNPEKNKSDYIRSFFQIEDSSRIVQILEQPSSALSRWYHISISSTSQNQILALQQNPSIELIQENNHFQVHEAPINDSLYSDQWYHHHINASSSWENYTINPDILIAIIDTGIDYEHPDLDGSVWVNDEEDLNGNGRIDPEDQNHLDDDNNGYVDDVIGWDFTDAPRLMSGGDDTDPDNDPMDDYHGGHGTKIAGIIAAQTNNYRGISGLIPGVKVMNLRAGTASGYLEEDDVAKAVLYAINNGARIINMSFGDVVLSRFLKDVIEYAYSKNIIIVASSGNSGNDRIHYPSGLAETISVGATDQNDNRASFSNFGGTIDLVAPGVDILSTSPGGGYGTAGGTSFSAPMVSATAALLLSKNEELTVEQVRNQIKTTSDDIGIQGWEPLFGSGRLNMEKASLIQDESSLVIHHPQTGSHSAEDTLIIIATASDPDLISLDLTYGIGTNPVEWIDILSDHNYQIIDDTIAILPLKAIPDTVLTLRLRSKTWEDKISEIRSIISLDRTRPKIENHLVTRQLDGAEYAYLINFETDDVCTADIYIRPSKSNENFTSVHLSYEAMKHYYLITPERNIEYYIKTTNYSGLEETDTNNGSYYQLESILGGIAQREFIQTDFSIPSGYLLPEATDFDQDGLYEIVISEYDENRNFGPVAVYEWENGHFSKQMETPFRAIPRSYGDADGDGKPELFLGYGQKSYLLESTESNSWSAEIVWSDTGTFWASRISDLDNDGKSELLGKDGQDFVLYESTEDNAYSKIFTFNNLSQGNNQLGPPRTEVADLDNDGYLEIYFGDYDGDIVAYENTGNNTFIFLGSIPLELEDATNFFITSNQSRRTLIAGSHTSTNMDYEHEFAAQYWSYSAIRMNTDNSYDIFQEIPVYGFADLRDFEAGCNWAVLNEDGEAYFFLAPSPDLYVFKTDGDSLLPVWHYSDVNTNTVLVYDFDGNGKSEFFFNRGDEIIAYTESLLEKPLPPTHVQAFPSDQTSIYLTWDGVPQSEKYIIYRGSESNNLAVYDSTYTETFFRDEGVLEGQTYYYSVRTVSSSFEQIYSNFSEKVSAVPNAPPRVDTLLVKNERQVEVYFNEKMDINHMPTVNFSLLDEENPTTSAIPFFNGQAVLLSFFSPFQDGGIYELRMNAIRDTNRTQLYAPDSIQTFIYNAESLNKPYIREWIYEGNRRLILKFNMPMNPETVLNFDNYDIEPSGSVISVEPMGTSMMDFSVSLSDDTYPPGSGITTYLILNGLHNARGELFEDGNRIALIQAEENIDNIIVYPQPLTREKDWLMFANLGVGTEIRIFDLNGHYITFLKEQDQNGGIKWDLKDKNGQKVNSGIYLYQAIFDNQKKMGKFTIIR